jgi:hypothetical protein
MKFSFNGCMGFMYIKRHFHFNTLILLVAGAGRVDHVFPGNAQRKKNLQTKNYFSKALNYSTFNRKAKKNCILN